jgi:hypothetical protein
MTTAVAPTGQAEAFELALVQGDLSKLTPDQRVTYYRRVCESLGLNPLTKPFSYITLNGKLTLYALKDCTEQLRKNQSVSVQIVAREVVEDCYVVTARATLPNGRADESIGAVAIGGLKGDARANGYMKAETKAKRRVTLSICGLGMLDETEVETIPGGLVHHEPAPVARNPAIPDREPFDMALRKQLDAILQQIAEAEDKPEYEVADALCMAAKVETLNDLDDDGLRAAIKGAEKRLARSRANLPETCATNGQQDTTALKG